MVVNFSSFTIVIVEKASFDLLPWTPQLFLSKFPPHILTVGEQEYIRFPARAGSPLPFFQHV